MPTIDDALQSKFKKFRKSFDDAVKTIEQYTKNKNPSMQALAQWLVAWPGNGYDLFHKSAWSSSLHGSAEDFSGLLSHIHHAVVDDGDICFPVINGSPKIVFASRWDLQDNLEALKHPSDAGFKFEVTFLGNVEEFIAARNNYDRDDARRCFVGDAVRQGFDVVLARMQKNPAYMNHITDDWVKNEGLKAIEEYKAKYRMLLEDFNIES
jgi:hypothetical protein